MTELFKEAIAWYNLPITVLLGFVVLYWIVASIGVFGEGTALDLGGDVDMDVDADMDLDAAHDANLDLDFDGDAEVHHGFGLSDAFMGLLRFVNMDSVPVMIVISMLVMSMWILSMVGNYIFTGAGSVLVAILVLFGSFVISLFVVKAATAPIARVFRKMKEADKETREPIVGRSGVVRSGSVSTDFGQVEISMKGAAPLIINARTREGNARLKKGDECIVIDEDEERDGIYFVRSI